MKDKTPLSLKEQELAHQKSLTEIKSPEELLKYFIKNLK